MLVNRLPTLSLLLGMLSEEANHLRGSVWALGIGVRTGGATARPRVPSPWTVHRSAMARPPASRYVARV